MLIIREFEKRNKENIQYMSKDKLLKETSMEWFLQSYKYEYSYHFKWLGRPIIQYPQDMVAIQEIIWQVKPDLIIETGIAHGGSLIFSASILDLIGKGIVVGVDIDIREHNRKAIEKHPLSRRIKIIEGSSTDKQVLKKIHMFAKEAKKVMVFLDSNHTRQHVSKELKSYSPLVTKRSYLVVFDTIIDDIPNNFFKDRPWGNNNNPKSAVKDFLKNNSRFRIDKTLENKLLITAAPSGYLKCIK